METSKDFEPEYRRDAQDSNVWEKALKMLVGTCFCQTDLWLGNMDTLSTWELMEDQTLLLLGQAVQHLHCAGQTYSLLSCWDAQGAYLEVHSQVGKQDQQCWCRRWVSPKSSREGPHSPSLGAQSWWHGEVLAGSWHCPQHTLPPALAASFLKKHSSPSPCIEDCIRRCKMSKIPPATKVRWQISPRQAVGREGTLYPPACVDINKHRLCRYFRCLLMHLVFMSDLKRYREISKYFKLTAQTYFHRINDAAKWRDFSSFPSGNGEELSPLILFPIFFRSGKKKKISLEIYLLPIRFQCYFLKPQVS